MIVRDRPGLFQVLFLIRGSVIERIYPQLAIITALSVAVVAGRHAFPDLVPVFSGAPFALLGVALSVFLGFRNSACYDRWWEARKQLGLLVAASRDLARQSLLLELCGERAEAARRELLYLVIAFTHSLVEFLRSKSEPIDIPALLPAELREAYALSRHRPAFLMLALGRTLAQLRADETLSAIEFGILDESVRNINGVLAACERLHGTPVPFGYTLLLLRAAYVFCLLVPFGFVDVLGWTTPIAAAVFGYTFFGLDALGDELEEPFGDLPNDLPLHAIAINIETNLREALGETELPAPLEPVDHVLK